MGIFRVGAKGRRRRPRQIVAQVGVEHAEWALSGVPGRRTTVPVEIGVLQDHLEIA